MFTVKWIADNGSEAIYNAKDVSYTPANAVGVAAVISTSPDAPKTGHAIVARDIGRAAVSFEIADNGAFCTLDSGHVYVMNGNGKTVASYILSTQEFPHGLAPRQAA